MVFKMVLRASALIGAAVYPPPVRNIGRARNAWIIVTLAMSRKNAPTSGATRNVFCDAPEFFRDGVHIGNTHGSGTEFEPRETGRDHGRIVVAPHCRKDDEQRKQSHYPGFPIWVEPGTTPGLNHSLSSYLNIASPPVQSAW